MAGLSWGLGWPAQDSRHSTGARAGSPGACAEAMGACACTGSGPLPLRSGVCMSVLLMCPLLLCRRLARFAYYLLEVLLGVGAAGTPTPLPRASLAPGQ